MDRNKLLWIQAVLFGVIFTAFSHLQLFIDLFKDRLWLQIIVYIGIPLISMRIVNALSRK
jgi:hypothetical protein